MAYPPGDPVTNPSVPGTILEGKGLVNNLLVDYETGGIAIQDPSQGHEVQIWKAEVVDLRSIYISSETTAPVLFYSHMYPIKSVSLAFDQAMQPVIAFQDPINCYLFYYSSTILDFEILTLPFGSRSPKVILDEKRRLFLGQSQVMLFYLKGTTFYRREQSSRYLEDIIMFEGIEGNLVRLGRSDKNRLQFEFAKPSSLDTIIEGELAKGSPVILDPPKPSAIVTSPSPSDLWELERKEN